MLATVGDGSSHFFARTNVSLDEVREGRGNHKRGDDDFMYVEHGRTCVVDIRP